MENGELTADALNRLLQIHTDRIAAYKKALNKSRKLELDLKEIFEKMIQESVRCQKDLSNQLAHLKTTSTESVSITGHSNEWIGTKAIVTGNRNHILTGCERDEEKVGDAYIMALLSKNTSESHIGQLLISQLEGSEILRHKIKNTTAKKAG